ncbi:uncharacterized protein LOC142166463 [Nicotiana tabacum]|uniref:Uncharacterized protein LOC142166463 n=1 Tax=Nicotiana tabacum TaxID=4097 RepID=A0AC58SAI1_TOBAC
MVLSWLLNSLSNEIAESVLYLQSANDLWSDLEDRFGQTIGAKLFQPQKELSVVIQGNTSISTYFTKIKSIWDELDALNTFSACICDCEYGAKAKNVKAHQDERLLQFLMGLNDTFIGVRSNILLSSPLPSIGNFRKYNENKGQKRGYDQKKNFGICAYYKKSGHIIDKCYRLHGFPAYFKFTKQRRFQGTVQANNTFTANEEVDYAGANTAENQILTQDNMAQLLQLLQHMKAGQQGASGSDASANLSYAGIAKFFNSYAYFIQINCESWILDSGTTEHMTFNKDFFTNFKALRNPLMVKLLNSYRVKGPSLKSPLEIGKEQEGLYILNSRPFVAVSKDLSKSSSACSRKSNSVLNSYFSLSVFDVKNKLWHYRLGHLPLSNMKNISYVSVPSCFNFSTPCLICPMARQCKLSFPSSSISTKKVFELIHVDTWGPYNTATYDGYRYFLTIVDDFSRAFKAYNSSLLFPVTKMSSTYTATIDIEDSVFLKNRE